MPSPADPPPKLKLVVRRLPPHLPEAKFWESVAPWCGAAPGGAGDAPQPSQEQEQEQAAPVQGSLWRRWVQGRPVDEINLHPVFSRAFILMPSQERALAFYNDYDGHAFRSKDGIDYRAQIELAPSQKVPTGAQAALTALLRASGNSGKEGKAKAPRVRVDARQGQIDTDADYLSFLRSLEAPLEKPKPEDFVSPTPAPTTSTPLLDHLRQQRTAKKAALAAQKPLGRGANGSASSGARGQAGQAAAPGAAGVGTGAHGAAPAQGAARNRPPKQRGAGSPKAGRQVLPATSEEARQKPMAILKRENGPKSASGPGGTPGAAGQRPGPPQPQQRGEGSRQAPPVPSAAGGPASVPPPNGPGGAAARHHPSKRERDREREQGRGPGAAGGGAGAALLSAALSASTGQARGKGGARGGRGGAPAQASNGTGQEARQGAAGTGTAAGPPAAGRQAVQGGDAAIEKKKRTRNKKPAASGGQNGGTAGGGDGAPAAREARIDD